MTEDQWIKLALEVNKVIDVTVMITIEGTARDLAIAWIKEAAAITAQGLKDSKWKLGVTFVVTKIQQSEAVVIFGFWQPIFGYFEANPNSLFMEIL